MNIYIYGTPSFKKEIHKTLIDSNIKLKLGANNLIKEIESLTALKEIISENSKEIFLIDDSKIIKKNSFAKKVKFLTPKDAIEEEFLLNSGIADLSVDSLEEIPKYILKKYEQEQAIEDINIQIEQENNESYDEDIIKKQEIILDNDNFSMNLEENSENSQENEEHNSLDDELANLLVKTPNSNEIEKNEELDNSIAELENLFVDDDKIGSVYDTNIVDFNDNFGLNNISFDYDDSTIINDTSSSLDDEELLKSLMSSQVDDIEETFENNVEESFEDIDFLDMILSEDKNKNLNKEEVPNIEIKNVEENNDIVKEPELTELLNKIEETKQTTEPIKGDKMATDDFSELDLINEKDLLDALNLEQSPSTQTTQNSVEVLNHSSNNEVVNISSSNIDDLAKLFSKILNNKTLEITIKIKD
ncbi:hypothetical protein [Arcobacter vandammei]|uniref:hypothetical protein n=1 Tax=Arcobacter vandammei TaxID=2782243 RepID=UPI0018E019E2|nr:hypothetical protein [Arcobacter vandammei]